METPSLRKPKRVDIPVSDEQVRCDVMQVFAQVKLPVDGFPCSEIFQFKPVILSVKQGKKEDRLISEAEVMMP